MHHRLRRLALFLTTCSVATLLFPVAASADEPQSVLVELAAGDHDRIQTPVLLELPQALRGSKTLSLVRADTGKAIDVQVLAGDPPRAAWILAEPLSAGQTRQYRLTASDVAPKATAAVTCRDDGKQLSVSVGDRPVLSYQHAVVEPPPGVAAHYRRSGFIHPLRTPAGRIVTDDFPPDHLHQHGVFFAWVNTTFQGRKVDFWNQAGELGTVEHVKLGSAVGGPVFAQFTATLHHVDLEAPDGRKPVLEDLWTVRVYNVGDPFVVDIESRQTCIADSPLAINEYHYGGMAVRGARQWFEQPQAGFLTSEGKDAEDGNHTRPRWVEMYGRVDGQPGGVVVLDDPRNFRFPQPVRLHPTKPYFCFATMVLGPFELKPGEEYVSRYRLATHDGKPDAALADRLWNDLGDGPVVRIVGGQ